MSLSIKLAINNELRRFGVERTVSWETLRAKIASVINVGVDDFFVYYVDEDDDNVRIDSDGETSELLASGDNLRLFVKFKTTAPVSDVEPTDFELQAAAAEPATSEAQSTVAESTSNPEQPQTLSSVEESSEKPSSNFSEHVSSSSQPIADSQPEPSSATPTTQDARTSAVVSKDLEALWANLIERNQDLFDQANQLQQELAHKLKEEAEERYRRRLEAHRQLFNEIFKKPNYRNKTVETSIVNGVKTTVVREVDEQGNETVTKETSDGRKQITYNGNPVDQALQPKEQAQHPKDQGQQSKNPEYVLAPSCSPNRQRCAQPHFYYSHRPTYGYWF